jgi:hypothetical protein
MVSIFEVKGRSVDKGSGIMCGATEINAAFRALVVQHIDDGVSVAYPAQRQELLHYVDRHLMYDFENNYKKSFWHDQPQPNYYFAFDGLHSFFPHPNISRGMYALST